MLFGLKLIRNGVEKRMAEKALVWIGGGRPGLSCDSVGGRNIWEKGWPVNLWHKLSFESEGCWMDERERKGAEGE